MFTPKMITTEICLVDKRFLSITSKYILCRHANIFHSVAKINLSVEVVNALLSQIGKYGRFYTRGRIIHLGELGQTFVIRLAIRL